jgi:3-oxoacyl-(acyl-carrier-protein) synthase
MTNIYINGLGNVSPQKTATGFETSNGMAMPFLEDPVAYETNQLRCIDPGYKEFIPAEMIRRMSRIIKMGVAAAKLCLRDAGTVQDENGERLITPDAIITGTGLGCMEDTEKFLISMIKNNEEFLTPTSFIQSTHNTVAGQIALLLQCHGYNYTYVHRGISFESALIDAVTQIKLGEFTNALVGGSDELTANSFAITARLGYWKQKPVNSLNLLEDSQRGSIAGEGASFLFLANQRNDHTYARLSGVDTFQKPASHAEVSNRLDVFLSTMGISKKDISLVILGLSGDPRTDRIYHSLVGTDFKGTPLAGFKHLCGEYHTASSFATWLAAMILKNQYVPDVARVGNHQAATSLNHVLIYNHFRENNHAFILLSRQ